ncbi:MAG: asparagine synthase (glutamine-hydrolyzing) [Desulfobacteraceae bacterium]|nr:MAG: asparagine synthase (glutamine-hydrolyzing) [Desulfobacteraceae bacterium]
MCGIAVILTDKNTHCPASDLVKMRDRIEHRGPDDRGMVLFDHNTCPMEEGCSDEKKWALGLAHRRLSIIDLSLAGHQPMSFQDRYWIVYNGEVYNYIELRSRLLNLGHVFSSSTDTEVILASYAEWGTECFSLFRGMWGMVIWDAAQKKLVLSRDRMGIKPLYIWKKPGMIAIGSEIKQFLHIRGFTAVCNPDAASEYLNTGYEDPDITFFSDVHPLPAGKFMTIDVDTLKQSQSMPFWYPERVKPVISDFQEAGDLFYQKLNESIQIHLRSDVPVGCALSGGLDSSSIAMIINQHMDKPFFTFTSTFPNDPCDERVYVDEVLRKIKAKPYFTTPDPKTFIGDLDHFLWIHDEPVGSISVYASFLISKLAREAGVPVTLNGQGGDEVFSGYWQTYFLHLWSLLRDKKIFHFVRHFAGAMLGDGNPDLWKQVPAMVRRFRSRRKAPGKILFESNLPGTRKNVLEKVMNLDSRSRRLYELRNLFLPRLLKWDDRNSMAFSVEGRYPFLDHELIELCLSFLPETLYSKGWTKQPLRSGLNNILPEKIIHRRSKFGFEVPQDKWLHGPLKPVIGDWLKKDRPVWDYVNHTSIQKLADETWALRGKQDEPGQALFRVFAFDRWLEIFSIQA